MTRSTALALLFACATEGSATTADHELATTADQAADRQQDLADAEREARAACDKLDGVPIPLRERYAVGRELALRAALALWVDPLPLTPPSRPSGLPPGPKNDVVSYVQRVGMKVAGARELAWTFGVVDERSPRVYSNVGGYVFLSTGLLSRLQNEAEVAAAVALGASRASGPRAVRDYAAARKQACLAAEPGARRTMEKLASPPGLDLGAEEDRQFMSWFTNRLVEFQQQHKAELDVEMELDSDAARLVTEAGYEVKALTTVLELTERARGIERIAAIDRSPVPKGGKSPKLPQGLSWPK